MRKSILLVVALAITFGLMPASAGAAGRCGNPAERPWCDTSLTPQARAKLLLAELTAAERIGLLGGDDPTGILDIEHTGTSNGIDRVGLPPLYFSDGPVGASNGHATAMPSPLALGATFSPDLARRYGATIADEVKKKGNDVLFAPTLDILRTPLAGRAYETFGEDPLLTTRLGVPWVKGAQAQGVIATAKHFAMNNQEGFGGKLADQARPGDPTVALGGLATSGSRFDVDARVDARTLREVYLKPFEAAIKAGVGSVMCAYNLVNGHYACENRELLDRYLRRTFGFRGMVSADYGAVHDTVASLKGGLDFEPWPGNLYGPAAIEAALADGKATLAKVDRAALAYLETVFRFGVADRPAHPDDDALIAKRAHANVAQQVSENSIVLMKNDGLLPLNRKRLKSVALIGAGVDSFVTGGGSSDVEPFSYTSPLSAIKKIVRAGTRVEAVPGTDFEAAVKAASRAQVAVVFAPDYLTEGVDRRCLRLECPPVYGDQDELIRKVVKANGKTVVVLETGGPVLTPWRGKVAGLLEAWYPGSRGGAAIARVLFGRIDPGGRLPATFPQRESQLPTAGDSWLYPGVDDVLRYKDGVEVGYRSYLKRGVKPAYAFGHGLSYTRFRLGKLKVLSGGKGNIARLRFRVQNLGRRPGVAVPQIYLRLPGSPKRSPKLAGFTKLRLAPDKARMVTIPIPVREAQVFKPGGGWKTPRGCAEVLLGTSSQAIKARRKIGLPGCRR